MNDKSYFKAVCIAEQLWEWLADNPGKDKRDWPLYKKYRKQLGIYSCSLCMYYEEKSNQCNCDACFLNNFCGTSYQDWREYNKPWNFNSNKVQKHATAIWRAIFLERLRIM